MLNQKSRIKLNMIGIHISFKCSKINSWVKTKLMKLNKVSKVCKMNQMI